METTTLEARTNSRRRLPAPWRETSANRRIAAVALATGFIGMYLSGTAEALIIRQVGATGHQLEWISDLMGAVAVSTLTYLWLTLRGARARLLDSERALVAVDEQFRLAAEIQRSLLPQLPASTPGYRWAARMEAAYQVGGDFYDFVRKPDGSVLLILGDVSGKGMPAALLQSSLTTLFRVHASMTNDPCSIARRMSEGLYERTAGKPFATAIVARIESSPSRITYVTAGHPPALVLRHGLLFQLDAGGPPLGLLPRVEYSCGTFDLQPGDLAALVTDGVTEAVDDWPELFRRVAIRALAATSAAVSAGDRVPADVCSDLVLAASRGAGPWGTTDWTDDRTVLAFRVTKPE